MSKRTHEEIDEVNAGPLAGQLIATAGGPLVYEQTDEYTFYLVQDNLKTIIENAGGKMGAQISGKTTTVVLGSTHMLFSAKNPDLWTGSAKYLSLRKQQEANETRKVPLNVVPFCKWLKDNGLEAPCKTQLHVAQHGKGRDLKTFGAGHLLATTLQWSSGDRKGLPVKDYHRMSPNGDYNQSVWYDGGYSGCDCCCGGCEDEYE